MKELNLLWADSEHPEAWESHIEGLNKFYCIHVEMADMNYPGKVTRLQEMCAGKDAFILHCGTSKPMASTKDIILGIKAKFPNIKVGLETNAIHPSLEDVVDFYVTKPISIYDLNEDLRRILD